MPRSSADPVVAENIRAVLDARGRSAYSVATAIGRAPNWLYRVVNGKVGILLPTLREVAAELGVSVGSLVDPPHANGQAPEVVDQLAAAESAPPYSPESRHIEVVELAAAAGSGAEVYDETVVSRLAFRAGWLAAHGIDAAQCNVIRVAGDSMEPTLPDGCSILVDRSRREPREDEIFVLKSEDGLVVKRLGKDAKGRWQLLSDNPANPPAPLLYGAEIIGEARWMGRSL